MLELGAVVALRDPLDHASEAVVRDVPQAERERVLAGVPGVTRVGAADMRPGSGIFEVQSERGRDVRREIAREVVTRGWGLLELRPMRMSLEDVFLQVTTEEPAPVVEEAPRA